MDYHGLDSITKQTFCLILGSHECHKKKIALGLVKKMKNVPEWKCLKYCYDPDETIENR